MNPPASNSPLIIAGMHRSGTTLLARWLQSCGLFIGHELLKAPYIHSNPGGDHYEDVDFLNFHINILRKNGIKRNGYVRHEKLVTDEQDRAGARALADARNTYTQWGWKEPRTCLFLDMWISVLPQAKLLVIYRHYEQVADSLLRRKLDHPDRLTRMAGHLRYFPLYRKMKFFIQVWNRYNRDLLDVIPQLPGAVLVIRADDLLSIGDRLVDFMNHHWGFHLAHSNLAEIYEKKRMQQQSRYFNIHEPRIQPIMQEAQIIYDQLEDLRTATLERL